MTYTSGGCARLRKGGFFFFFNLGKKMEGTAIAGPNQRATLADVLSKESAT